MLRPGAWYSVHFLSRLLFVYPVLIVSFKRTFIYLYEVVVVVVVLSVYEYACVCVCVCPPVCHSTHVQARAELAGTNSLLSLCGSWGLRQASLPAESSPLPPCVLLILCVFFGNSQPSLRFNDYPKPRSLS